MKNPIFWVFLGYFVVTSTHTRLKTDQRNNDLPFNPPSDSESLFFSFQISAPFFSVLLRFVFSAKDEMDSRTNKLSFLKKEELKDEEIYRHRSFQSCLHKSFVHEISKLRNDFPLLLSPQKSSAFVVDKVVSKVKSLFTLTFICCRGFVPFSQLDFLVWSHSFEHRMSLNQHKLSILCRVPLNLTRTYMNILFRLNRFSIPSFSRNLNVSTSNRNREKSTVNEVGDENDSMKWEPSKA